MAMIDANAGPRGAQEDLGHAAGGALGNGTRSTVEPGLQDLIFLDKGILSYMRGILCLARERLPDYLYLSAEEQVCNGEGVNGRYLLAWGDLLLR